MLIEAGKQSMSVEETYEVCREIDVLQIDLSNKLALKRASRLRSKDDYQPQNLTREPYTLPAFVLRGLVNIESANNLLQLGIPDLRLEIVRFPVISKTGEKYLHPMKVITAFTFQGEGLIANVGGPVFVSDLHEIVTSPLSLEQKIKIVEGALSAYKDQTDQEIIVISIPKRKFADHSIEIKPGNSLTHTLLVRQAGGGENYREVKLSDGSERGFYFLIGSKNRHRNEAKRRALIEDPEFRLVLDNIGTAWGENFYRELPLDPQINQDLATIHRDEMVELMDRSWK